MIPKIKQNELSSLTYSDLRNPIYYVFCDDRLGRELRYPMSPRWLSALLILYSSVRKV